MNVDYLRLFNSMAYLVYFFQRVVTCMIKIVIKIHFFYRKYKCVEIKIVLTAVVCYERLKCD